MVSDRRCDDCGRVIPDQHTDQDQAPFCTPTTCDSWDVVASFANRHYTGLYTFTVSAQRPLARAVSTGEDPTNGGQP